MMEKKNEILKLFRSFLKIIYEFIKGIIYILLVYFVIRSFLIQPFIVDGPSMEPNFHNKEYLLVDRISYRFKEPQRGEVVIFHPPNKSVYYIKRIIALPGEKITIESGKIFVYNKQNPQGSKLSESYLRDSAKTTGAVSATLGADEYYLLGDNRENSLDSRDFGKLPRKNITGRTFFAVFPASVFGLVKTPLY